MNGMIAQIGRRTLQAIDDFGSLCRFSWATMGWLGPGVLHARNLRLMVPQFYDIGTRSIPVVVVTGAFVGMVLAVQTVMQFQSLGMESQMGTVVNLSVLKELGPVLAGVLLAGRVGGGLAAELGTMRVTEQIDALEAMGSSPLRVLVVPRFLACVLLIPVLVIYADFMGILGGYIISVYIYGVNPGEFWRNSQQVVEHFDIFYGPVKSVFFGAAISLISCYKGFTCEPGAAGVGRACTQSFVTSCMAVLMLDFFIGTFLNSLYIAIYGFKQVL